MVDETHPMLCTFPDCHCTGRDAVKCAKLESMWDGVKTVYNPRVGEKTRFAITWIYNPFSTTPTGYLVRPYLPDGTLNPHDYSRFNNLNLPESC